MSDPGSLIFPVLVFATVFAVVALVGLRFLASASGDPGRARGTDLTPVSSEQAAWTQHLVESSAAQNSKGAAARRGQETASRAKATVRTVLRVLAGIFLAYLVMITVIMTLQASPHDGSYLVSGILVIITLMAAGYFHRLDQQFGPSPGDGTLRDDLLRSIQADLAAKIGRAVLDGSKVELSVAAPQVYKMDLKTLESGRSMLADGKSMEEVCRAIEPDYDTWSAGHQQAYQSIVRAALEHDVS